MNKWILFAFVFSTMWAKAGDTIVVKKDPRLDLLTQKQALLNKRASFMTSTGQFKGFRLQVISTPNRDQAFKLKADLLTHYPDQKTYVMFQSPYFKVRLGNFLKKDEAIKFRQELFKYFKQNVYIVEDAIEYILKDDEEPIPQ